MTRLFLLCILLLACATTAACGKRGPLQPPPDAQSYSPDAQSLSPDAAATQQET